MPYSPHENALAPLPHQMPPLAGEELESVMLQRFPRELVRSYARYEGLVTCMAAKAVIDEFWSYNEPCSTDRKLVIVRLLSAANIRFLANSEATPEGYPLKPRLVVPLGPYLTQHIHRFGRYDLNLGKRKRPPELIYELRT